jgi:site-specific recombinase XerD
MATLDADLLDRAEVEALLGALSRRAPTGVRNRALLALMWRAGLRVSEALALQPKDVDLTARTVVVQRGKGGKRRTVGIDTGTVALIRTWLVARSARPIGPRAPLFCTLKGNAIDTSYVRHLLPRLAERAGIEKRVHAHGLRHRFAVDLVHEGAPITTLRDLLGHSSIAVTDQYLRRIGAGEAIAFARGREWSLK